MQKRSPLEEWLEIIHGAMVMMVLAALFPLFALYDLIPPGAPREAMRHTT
jgi:hypothetical protein